jgi:hypothetical protein
LYDFISLQETWDLDTSYCESYFSNHVMFSLNAKKSSFGGRPMGGVTVFVKSSIASAVKRVKEDFQYGIVLIIDRTLFSLDTDVLYVTLYIPPHNSPFYDIVSISGLQQLENIIVENNYLDYELLLNGDFNARTGSADDFICCSENIPEFHEVRDMINSEIELNRRSADKVINQSGRDLLTFCKTYSCYIANGRLQNGCSDGFTFINSNGSSTIDYFILSKGLIDIACKLDVLNRTESDHLPLSLELCTSNNNIVPQSCNEDDSSVVYNMNVDNADVYLNNLSESAMDGKFDHIDRMLNDLTVSVSEIISQIEHTIQENCEPFRRMKKIIYTKRVKNGLTMSVNKLNMKQNVH